MPSSPFPVTATDPNEMLQQMQSLMDDLYQNRLGGANVGDVFQIGADDVFQLRYLAIGGLQKLAGALAIHPNIIKGIDCDRNGIFVVLKPDFGLEFDGLNGIAIKLKSGGGLTVDSTGLSTTAPITKAAGTDIDTGTDDSKYVTSKSINDSHNVPDVAPGTAGKVLTSNGTDWISSNSSTAVRGTFTNTDLATGILTITHNKALSAPYAVSVSVFNNSNVQVALGTVTGLTNTTTVDLSAFGAFAGTWGYVLI